MFTEEGTTTHTKFPSFLVPEAHFFSEYIKKGVPGAEKDQPPLGFFPEITFILMLLH